MSSGTHPLDANSRFDDCGFTVGSRPSDQSYSKKQALQSIQKKHPRLSFSFYDEDDVEYVDSSGLARVLIHSLNFGLGIRRIDWDRLAIDDDDFSSKLRQNLERYCAEVQSTDQPDTLLPQSDQNPLYQKGHSMVLKEIQNIVKESVSIFSKGHYLFTLKLPHEGRKRSGDIGEDAIPMSIVRGFLMGGKAFGRLEMRIRRLVKQDIMRIISDEVSLNRPPTAPRLTSATFHVRWELFDHILNEQDGSTDIGQTLVVTGEGRKTYASRCADYLKWLWKDSKYDICSHNQQYVEGKSYSKPTFFRDYLMLTIYQDIPMQP